MKTRFRFSLLVIFLFFTSLIINACRSEHETVSCFPESPINVVLNINYPAYQALQNVGGWLYVDEQQSGTRGLIVVRATNGFKIYDRNAPHLCPANDTTLYVEDQIKIVCPKDGAEWILITGEPIKVSQIAPKTYRYNFDAITGILSIFY